MKVFFLFVLDLIKRPNRQSLKELEQICDATDLETLESLQVPKYCELPTNPLHLATLLNRPLLDKKIKK